MKTIHHVTSALITAGSVGVAILTLSEIIPAEIGFATLSVAGIFAFAILDYSRPTRSLVSFTPLLRPNLPVVNPHTETAVRRAA